jgi:hypothetical protein
MENLFSTAWKCDRLTPARRMLNFAKLRRNNLGRSDVWRVDPVVERNKRNVDNVGVFYHVRVAEG